MRAVEELPHWSWWLGWWALLCHRSGLEAILDVAGGSKLHLVEWKQMLPSEGLCWGWAYAVDMTDTVFYKKIWEHVNKNVKSLILKF